MICRDILMVNYMEKFNFIRTTDEATAIKLRQEGFQELPKQGVFFMFINNPNIAVKFDEKKIKFTNMINM